MQKLATQLIVTFIGIAAFAAAVTPASAAVELTSVPGTAVYSGPSPVTFNFETATPQYTGGAIVTGTSSTAAQPLGSTGKYATSGPSAGTGVLNLSSFGDISWISFIWGSIDDYNTLEVLDTMGTAFASFTGSSVIVPANGNQSSTATNRLVTLTFTGEDQAKVNGLRFKSTGNAFEFDNVTVAAVPEPATWMMMMLGMGAVGFSLRRKNDTTLRVRFA